MHALNLKNNKMNHYETVFILNPVLSEDQTKETVQKYEKYLTSKGAKMISIEDWGLKKLAYPIKKVDFITFSSTPLIQLSFQIWN